MLGVLKTIEEARAYAIKIEGITSEKHHIFHVPEGTMGYKLGYRFGTCRTEERPAYEKDGAKFV